MKTSLIIVLLISACAFFIAFPHGEGKARASETELQGAMPGVAMLDSLVDIFEPVRFDHTMHTYVAEGCGTCHHQHGTDDSLSCKGCHALDANAFKKAVVNSFLACRSCHDAYDPETPSMPGLKVAYHSQCFKCHRGMGNVGLDPKGCTEQCHAKR